jgi:hypothetical protein
LAAEVNQRVQAAVAKVEGLLFWYHKFVQCDDDISEFCHLKRFFFSRMVYTLPPMVYVYWGRTVRQCRVLGAASGNVGSGSPAVISFDFWPFLDEFLPPPPSHMECRASFSRTVCSFTIVLLRVCGGFGLLWRFYLVLMDLL